MMKNFFKKGLDGVVMGVAFSVTLGTIVYAATIVNVGPQTISSGDTIGAGWFQDVNNQLLSIASMTPIPTGAVIAFNDSVCPTGWTEADGSGDEKNTSGVNTTLDLRGEFIRGWDHGKGVDTGRNIGTSQLSQNLSHNHTGTTSSAGSHSHTTVSHIALKQNDYGIESGYYKIGVGGSAAGGDVVTGTAGAHTHTFTSSNNGGTESRPRNIALIYCVKN